MPKFLATATRIWARIFSSASRQPGHDLGSGDQDGLLAFQAETSAPAPARTKGKPPANRRIVVAAAVLLAAASASIVYIATGHLQAARPAAPSVPATPMGMATIDSYPAGTVRIDGVDRGRTPLSLQLPAGPHSLVIIAGQSSRSLPLDVEAGVTIRQNVEFTAAAVPSTGRLEVTSEPAGARVSVDGTARGSTPLSIAEIAAGPHQLTITSGETTTRRRVTIVAGALASVDASIAASDAGSAAGWLALASPVELTLAEDDQIVGTTKAARVMLPAGNHNIVLSNPALEFQMPLAVRIESGKTLKRAVALPTGSLSVNAVPWANVSVDGADLGTTPLANVALPIGSHEIVWRHPQLGERRRTVSIMARTPTRVGMDFK